MRPSLSSADERKLGKVRQLTIITTIQQGIPLHEILEGGTEIDRQIKTYTRPLRMRVSRKLPRVVDEIYLPRVQLSVNTSV